MAKKAATDVAQIGEVVAPKSLKLAAEGIHTGAQFANVMSTLMTDLIAGSIQPQIANAVCNAGGKLLKVVEMQHKYGKPNGANAPILQLTT